MAQPHPINLPELTGEQASVSTGHRWVKLRGWFNKYCVESIAVNGLLNVALVPVVAFYLMRDWDLMMAGIMSWCRERWYLVSQVISEAHSVLEAFVRGQLVVMGAQALIYSVGLWLVGLNYAIVLGLVAGAASIIPYAGAVIGVGSALIVGYLQFGLDLWALGLIGSVFIIGQLIESFALTPLLIGDRIGLHPSPLSSRLWRVGSWRLYRHIDRLTCGGRAARILSSLGEYLPYY